MERDHGEGNIYIPIPERSTKSSWGVAEASYKKREPSCR